MRIKQFVWSSLLALALSATATFGDIISGAAFQTWAVTNLNQSGSPYWDNTSMDGTNKNVGFYLTNAPTAHLPGAPGALPFWGSAFDSVTDSGGAADPNFFFLRTAPSSAAILKLEVAGKSNVNEFGWYDTTDPTVQLHPMFFGPDTALTTTNFSPTPAYGFYLKSGGTDTYYTQSSLNSNAGDTSRQHFALFRESETTGAEIYWIGIEDLTAAALGNNESGVGDYNDMLIRISAIAIPEPSTAMLIVTGTLLLLGLRNRRR